MFLIVWRVYSSQDSLLNRAVSCILVQTPGRPTAADPSTSLINLGDSRQRENEAGSRDGQRHGNGFYAD